jgi:BNR repeat-like domain
MAVVAGAPAAGAHAAGGFATEQVWQAGTDDWEPTVAVDPSSSYVYQVTTRYGGQKVCGKGLNHCLLLRASSDGGAHWGPNRPLPATPNTTAQNDPEVKVASDGTVYAAWLNDYDVMVARSTDHGATWTAPVDLRLQSGLHFTDKPILVISPTGTDVYVAFNASDSYVATSHDHGATFTISPRTNADGLYWFAEEGAIAPNGTVMFAESAEQQTGLGQTQLAVVRSSDAGAHWSTTVLATSQERPACTTAGCTVDFYGSQAAVAIDRGGKALAVYAANSVADAPLSLYARTSTDGGATWTVAQLVSSAGSAVGANFPQLATGPTQGDFRLAFMDDRNGPSAWNTWFTTTTGSGWTAPVRLSNATTGAPYKTAAGFASPYGDYLGLAVTPAGVDYAIWGEGTSYTGPGGVWSTHD